MHVLTELCNIVREVGQVLLDWRSTGGSQGAWEGAQFKARGDTLAHEALCERLAKLTPGLPVLSEEDPASHWHERPGQYWIIDPLDGTASYAHGFAGFVTQAALVTDSAPTLAAVYAPALERLYSAQRGQGAYVNGERLRASAGALESLIDNYPEPRGITADLFRGLAFARYIESGSIGLKICRVADGTASVFFKNIPVRDWDVAAPQLLLTEAGGWLSDSHGRPFAYQGPVEHEGLVAASTEAAAAQVIAWYAKTRL